MSIYHSKKKSRPQILFDKSQENVLIRMLFLQKKFMPSISPL